MKPRLPLYAKILGWFFLNLLLLVVVFYAVFRAQFHFGLDSLLAGEAGERIQSISEFIIKELNDRPHDEWSSVLQHSSDAYKVKFYLFQNDGGVQLAGETVKLPQEIFARVTERGPQALLQQRLNQDMRPPPPEDDPTSRQDDPGFQDGPPPRDGLPGDRRPPARQLHPEQNAHPRQMMHTDNPPGYWVLVRLPLNDPGRPLPMAATLVAMSRSLSGNGFFFDFKPWLFAGCGAVILSLLFWFPLVRSITRSVSRMQNATAQIAEGHFDSRVNETRRDELGSLGGAINRMAARLSGFVTGQKRFLGDIAHELCSPIARMQMAVGILEERGDPKDAKYIADLREEVQEMSSLVNELLSFSKASLGAGNFRLQSVSVRAAVEKAVKREAEKNPDVQIQIDESLHAMADSELLVRAVSNLLRNAARYAGNSPISISATADGGEVELIVADGGPGVPESEIPKLFDPFYRVDTSRTRETGGAGLGLSIVKTCIETCRGSVTCRNRNPSGLEVVIRLPNA